MDNDYSTQLQYTVTIQMNNSEQRTTLTMTNDLCLIHIEQWTTKTMHYELQ